MRSIRGIGGGRAYTVDSTAPVYADVYSLAGGPGQMLVGPARYELSVELTRAEVEQLARDRDRDGFMTATSYRGYGGLLFVSGIELTGDEARQIAVHGADPLDVLFPVWPEYGYRLTAVPVTNLGGT